ncbi:MAG: hypothetical protein HKN92_03545 [Chitinophagales bacterium]|nr:hypothetical protein [Chitinophagales bacterium]
MPTKLVRFTAILLLVMITLLFQNCRDENLITDPNYKLEFSSDTLSFDTVFTTRGSVTKSIRVFNREKRPVRISTISLAKSSGDQFRLNVDGIPGTDFSDIEIPAQDSIWVFVEVTVDPMDIDNPFVIDDLINFTTNGNEQHISLRAWGQDAYFYVGQEICNETWTKDRPYVIVGTNSFPGIHVDTNCVLTIEAGTRIFLHDNAGIFVSGSLQVMGTQTDTVVFEGDRLESFFDDLPSQWFGIFFMRGSVGNDINYAVINEADYGISAGSSFDSDPSAFSNASRPVVNINNTIIKNSQVNSIFGFNAEIQAVNCLSYNTNDNLLALGLGGSYEFVNCTFVNTGSVVFDHKNPILLLGNAAEFPNVLLVNDLEKANFQNCIFFGSLDEELSFGKLDDADFIFSFESCMLTTFADTVPEFSSNNIINQNPDFVSISDEDFHLTQFSPAVDAGTNPVVPISTDLDGKTRISGAAIDIGAYEFN